MLKEFNSSRAPGNILPTSRCVPHMLQWCALLIGGFVALSAWAVYAGDDAIVPNRVLFLAFNHFLALLLF